MSLPGPAAPANAMPEWSSAANTFSMRRLAMAKPLVARRSPASTTPSAKRMATTVVPCAMSAGACWPPAASGGGASGGEVRRSSSANDGPGSEPGPNIGSGRSFIDERAYTGELSANAPEQSPELHSASQLAHGAVVVHALEDVCRGHVSRLDLANGIDPRPSLAEEPPCHAASLRRPPAQCGSSFTRRLGELGDISRTLLCVLDVDRGAVEPLGIVAELPESPVAVEAKDAAKAACGVIVIDMLGTWSRAYRTDVALFAHELVELRCADAIAPLQVIVTRASMQACA